MTKDFTIGFSADAESLRLKISRADVAYFMLAQLGNSKYIHEAVNFLKKEHKITHGFSNTIVKLSKEETASPTELVKNQYKGKENLLPIL